LGILFLDFLLPITVEDEAVDYRNIESRKRGKGKEEFGKKGRGGEGKDERAGVK